ncbi:MAG: hypothetical protein WCF12_02615, partial [Propionicimonas sp.]
HLRAGEIPMNTILLNDVAQVDADVYLQTHSTNPLLKPATVREAVQRFHAAAEAGRADSLFTVTRIQARLWDAHGAPVNHDPDVLLRTQDLDPVYIENSCAYLFTKEVLVSRGNRIGASPMMFEIDPLEATDIDEERDFRLAEALWRAGYRA